MEATHTETAHGEQQPATALVVGKRYRFLPPERNHPFDWTIVKRDRHGYIRCTLTWLYTAGRFTGRADVLVRVLAGFQRPRWIDANRLEEIPGKKA